MKKKDRSQLTAAYQTIVDHLRNNTDNRFTKENFKGTAERCVRALLESSLSDKEIRQELAKVISTFFPVAKGKGPLGMLTQGPISINSTCPHHLAPVRYEAYVSYIPSNAQVLGLSKLSRIAKILGMRPVLQEQLSSDIADVLYTEEDSNFPYPSIESSGSAVMLVGLHTCMACRGVQEAALTAEVDLRGIYKTDSFEQKFYAAVESIRHAKPF